MNRQDLANMARQRLYAHAPELTSHLAGTIVNSEPFQRWMDRIERKRPRGVVAWVRRLRGKDRGLDAQELHELEQLSQKALEKIGR